MEPNSFFDLYTISEIFSQYPEIASSWKQTGKLPYKLTSNIYQNCQLAISKNEFYNYLLSLFSQRDDVTCPILFSRCNNNNDITAIDYNYDKFRHYRRLGGKSGCMFRIRYYNAFVNDRVYMPRAQYSERADDELLPKDDEKKVSPWNNIPKSFRDGSRRVFFDVVTTYNILKLRETCYDVIPNYAKVKVLEQFNNFFHFLLNINLYFCGFYVSFNARSLHINISTIIEECPDSVDHLKEMALKITGIINSWK
jgi:hypothetical protein